MEFDELQKIWDSQNNQPLYAINEKALHNRIQSKMKRGRHITNFSELLLILVNLGAGSFVLGVNLSLQRGNIFMYILAAWMFATFVYILVSRVRRIKGDRRFDRGCRDIRCDCLRFVRRAGLNQAEGLGVRRPIQGLAFSSNLEFPVERKHRQQPDLHFLPGIACGFGVAVNYRACLLSRPNEMPFARGAIAQRNSI